MSSGALWLQVVDSAFHQIRNIVIPLVPIMSARTCMELIAKMYGLQNCGEPMICGQQTFHIATGKKEIWTLSRIGRSHEDKRITGAAALTSPWPENRSVLPILADAFDGNGRLGTS